MASAYGQYGADRDWQVIDITPTAAGASARARGGPEGSNGLTTQEAERLLVVYGRNELPSKRTPKWLIFLQQLYGPMPIMIWLAIIIEIAIQNYLDMGILLVIQFTNAIIGWYEMSKAGDAVAALKATLKPTATVKRDGHWVVLDATLLVPGDLVLLRAGNSVPADCFVNDGQVEVDQSALTGESMPVTRYTGESVMMGSTVARGETEATVQHTGKNTSFGKTASMLSGVRNIGNLNRILLRIMLVLVSLSVLLCSISFAVMLSDGQKLKDAAEYVVVLMVASIPVAIEIVCTTTLALGSRELSAKGAIVTRLAAIEEMAGMNVLCSDKTGTLTQNKMVIQDDFPIFESGETWRSVLQHAALATRWWEPPRDALDTLVLEAADLDALSAYTQVSYTPFDSSIKRTEATVQKVAGGGPAFQVTKGAPDIVLKLIHNVDKIGADVMSKVDDLAHRGIRGLAVARTDSQGRWVLLGIITFLDPPRADTRDTIAAAMRYGVDVKMVTGDHLAVARETARVLGMGMDIRGPDNLPAVGVDGYLPPNLGQQYGSLVLHCDGFAQVLPEHKYVIVEALRQGGFAVGMTGDGVNDTPALKRADVGIAVEGSTDAAMAAADIVLTRPGLSVIIDALLISRCIFQRAKSFITYRIAATLQLLIFFFLASIALRPTSFCSRSRQECAEFKEFFELPVVMLMLITLLNDGTLISIAYDRAEPSERPEKWNLPVVFLVSSTLGLVACLSSIILLWAALDAWRPEAEKNLLQLLGLPRLDYAHIVTMIYLKVSISDFLTLFSSRTQGFVLTSPLPSPILLVCAVMSLILSTILACVWPNHIPVLDLSVPAEGLLYGPKKTLFLWVWAYCLVWWVIQDLCKVAVNTLVLHFDLFGARTGKLVNAREVSDFSDGNRGLALEAAGMVEGKVLGMKARQALAKTNKLSSSPPPLLARVSDDLQRISDSMDRVAHEGLVGAGSPARPGARDVEQPSRTSDLGDLLNELAADTAKLPRGTQDQLKGELQSVQSAGQNLHQVARVVSPAVQRRGQGDLLGSIDGL